MIAGVADATGVIRSKAVVNARVAALSAPQTNDGATAVGKAPLRSNQAATALGQDPNMSDARLVNQTGGDEVLVAPGEGPSTGETCMVLLVPVQAGPDVAAGAVGQMAAASHCVTNASFDVAGITETLGAGPGGETFGITPDGTSAATLTLANGQSLKAHVSANAFVVRSTPAPVTSTSLSDH